MITAILFVLMLLKPLPWQVKTVHCDIYPKANGGFTEKCYQRPPLNSRGPKDKIKT